MNMKKFVKKVAIFVAIAVMFPFMMFADSNITIKSTSVVNVHDGDTFKINVTRCYHSILCEDVPVRVSHIDTPEIYSKNLHEKQLANKAKQFTVNFINNSKKLVMVCGRDKYFRLNCSVSNGKQDLATELIKNKLAVPYEGGVKDTDWSIR